MMTQEKINTLTGCPRGRERDSAAVSTCTFLASSPQELLKAPSALMWGRPLSLVIYWVNRDKSYPAKHQKAWRAEEEQVTTGATDLRLRGL